MENDSMKNRITYELEPKLKNEARAYDNWVLTDRALEAEECFVSDIDSIIDKIEEEPDMYIWGDADGDIYQKILEIICKEIKTTEKELNK